MSDKATKEDIREIAAYVEKACHKLESSGMSGDHGGELDRIYEVLTHAFGALTKLIEEEG